MCPQTPKGPASSFSIIDEKPTTSRPENLDAYDLVMRALPTVWSNDAGIAAQGLSLLGRADYKPEFKLSVNVREDSDASETQMPRLEVAGSYPIAARRNSTDSSEER